MDIGNAVCIDFPAVIKSHIEKGRRTIWVEASNQEPDSEGDVILQSALLGSAEYFLEQGHIDIDHISEIGARLSPPVRDPGAFIIGKPISVEDAGGGRTAVVWELGKGAKAEEFWSSLLSGEGLPWRASIYGFPLDGGITECQSSYCTMGATRYLVKAIQWKSLAMTQHPVNDAIRGAAKVVSAKAFIKSLSKAAHAQSNLPDTLMYTDSAVLPTCAGVLFTDGREVFLLHRTDRDEWEGPGGHLEPGESAEQAAKRETEEEAGVSVPLKQMNHPDRQSDYYTAFEVPVGKPDFRFRLNHEHDKGQLFDLAHLPDAAHPNLKKWAKQKLQGAAAKSNEMNADPSQQEIPPTGELNSLGEGLPMLAMSEQPDGVCGREALWKEYTGHIATGDCPHCLGGVNVVSLRQHFQRCDGMPFGKADILALALIHLLQRAR